ncbi:adenylyl-sulfate reductase subunit alpha [Caldanaerobius polysaccharolyticus]|uniref:adenylyl-sulfate reductase subunit alpha n=1 Tax=Caldanaerobius polysaccharolyticus TaxID=44256 RepID=UPI00054D954D|nr:adenylyl-sulfate reductase subunit alpha [Caldanaerobius polysaccharolyticus]
MHALKPDITVLDADVLIIGGGAAGCQAAITAREKNSGLKVVVIEKAHVERSGCLAAGVNAINAYLNPGETPASYVDYVKKDTAGLIREDLTYTIGERLNRCAKRLEEWGLPYLKDEKGDYVPRGRRSVRINGERIKPIMAEALKKSGAVVLNRVVAVDYIVKGTKVIGAFAFSVRENKFYVIRAKAVICATGGAAGLYKPNNDGSARHKMWYPPFNTGAGFAMGLRAGAEMTSFEMRFIALRIKDVLSPTGTIAQGVHAPQINAKGEAYLKNYSDRSTYMRLYATIKEDREGRGPCYLDITGLSEDYNRVLKEAYLNMSPGIVLKWADEGIQPTDRPVEICGSEPYIVGGHGLAGYWVDKKRRTTLEGLYAAGDVAGGSPKKYVTGSMAEGEIAAEDAVEYIKGVNLEPVDEGLIEEEVKRVYAPLFARDKYEGLRFGPDELEERLQKIMDEYAGGISSYYEVYEERLNIAKKLLKDLQRDLSKGYAEDLHDLMKYHEVADRVLVARAVVEHLLYRKETRWRCYQERVDYPFRDDENWLKFVNSVYDPVENEIKIIERPYDAEVDY